MNCLTLFAGAGGADVGLARAGFCHLACVEGDASACATLRAAGFPAVLAWIGGPGPDGQSAFVPPDEPVDLLWASPPCQPYSMAGKRQGAEDARDGWPATLGVIKQVRPRWVIVENVQGAPVDAWSEQLAALGYVTSNSVIDAVDWGLPSHRKRSIIVAGPTGYRWPTPTHQEGNPLPPFHPWVSFGEALGLPGTDWYLTPTNGGHIPAPRRCVHPSHCIVISASNQRLTCKSKPGRRTLTVEEYRILLGFPEGYPFQGSKQAQYRQIGNAVAPIMAEVLARGLTVDPEPCKVPL